MIDPLLNEYSGLLAAVEKLQRDVAYLNRVAAAIPLGSAGRLSFVDTKIASAVASVEFKDLTTALRYYMFVLRNVRPATDNTTLQLTASINNGATYLAGTSYEHHRGQMDANAAATYQGAGSGAGGAAQIDLGSVIGNVSPEGFNGIIEFFIPTEGSHHRVHWRGVLSNVATNMLHIEGGAHIEASAAVNALKFAFSSGNIAAGQFDLYALL